MSGRGGGGAVSFVLALSCPDRPGIIRAVAGHLADAGCNVTDSQQFADPLTRRFFLRAEADPPPGLDLDVLRGSFAGVGLNFGMDRALHDAAARPRVLILVSKAGHCLNDLLFLPSFAGARPYHQAYERGVKLIGATAHYVTADLDEGPIIEQDVARVDHAFRAEQLVAAGQDVEAVVLARAVRWHVEHRVMLNGTRTVVFR